MIPQSRVIHRYVRNMPITLAPPLCNYDHGTINPDFLSITGSNVFGDRRTDNRARWAACACNLYLNKPRTKPQDKYERSVESCTRVRAIFARLRLPSGRSRGWRGRMIDRRNLSQPRVFALQQVFLFSNGEKWKRETLDIFFFPSTRNIYIALFKLHYREGCLKEEIKIVDMIANLITSNKNLRNFGLNRFKNRREEV